MAFNFPNAPTNGQLFTPVPGLTYRWNNTAKTWETVPQTTGTLTALPYNMVLNPSMAISQEWNNTAVGNDKHVADLWYSTFSVLVGTWQRIQNATTMNSKNRLRLLPTNTSILAGSEYAAVVHWMEGTRCSRLFYGWPNAIQSVLRFWVRAPAGNWSIGIRNSDYTRGRSFLYNISASEANKLVEKNIIIPGDTGGGSANGTPAKWGNSLTGPGPNIWWTFACSTTLPYIQPPGSWMDANIIAATGMTNGWTTTSNLFELADVGWYADPYNTGLPPKWETRSEDKVLMDCQRHWWPCRDLKGISGSSTYLVRGATKCPVPMRVAPVTSIGTVGAYPCNAWDASTLNAIQVITTNYNTRTHIEADCNTNVGVNTGSMSQQLNEIASYPGYLAVSARLVG